jgi:hypothetical protein
MIRWSGGVVAALALAALAPVAADAAPQADPSPAAEVSARGQSAGAKVTTTGRQLAVRFLTLLKNHDVRGLRTFLSPAFQLQREDGTAYTRATYLRNLPTIRAFRISRVVATRNGNVLVVRYRLQSTGVYGQRPEETTVAPRLSVFQRSGGAWQLIAHSNFAPLS